MCRKVAKILKTRFKLTVNESKVLQKKLNLLQHFIYKNTVNIIYLCKSTHETKYTDYFSENLKVTFNNDRIHIIIFRL